jgi:hypothetical protein
MSVCCVCCVDRGLCDGLITRPEECYRLCVCVCVCLIVRDLATSTMAPVGLLLHRKRKTNGCLGSSVSVHDVGVGSAGGDVSSLFIATLSLEIRLACRHEKKRVQT